MKYKNSELNDIETCAADWIAERDRSNGQLPPERRTALDAWLAASTAHRVAYLRLEQAWQRAERLRALQPGAPPLAAPESPGLDVRGEAAGRQPAGMSGWRTGRQSGGTSAGLPGWLSARPALWRGAAGVGLATLALVLGLQFVGPRPDTVDYATARGQRESVMLADGSRLTLNTATQVRTEVTPQSRQVWLQSGEAFFDIAHDAQRPFVIHAGKQRVTVLGTKFSLQRDGDKLRVTVLEGRVQVQADQASSRPTVLARADTAVAEADNLLVTRVSPQQLSARLGWLQGKLVLNEVTLAEAARQFNRYGRKQLVIQDAAAERIVIGGVFEAGNVEAFARLLHAGFGLQVQDVGEEIRVSSPGS
ncbi:MAG: FecR domain-containing protein [Mitsuaria chitosanitabida]|uniref:FecR family protein n=1 Tax=Roseateles chitosanitabidus TaxID=65048 RepID=UPI001B0CF8CD|nr:FecR domain-containing protein [Roseateles chitosanitabidus]MBO9689275.1 FecR domain-containing protein [Roseateles chitosanitabidus]